jgi:hypothetical protein
MSHYRGQSDILLVSIAVFILFAISSIMADPAGGSDRPAEAGSIDTAYVVTVE